MGVRKDEPLPAWIIDEMERERREHEDRRLPLHAPVPDLPMGPVEEKPSDRGVVIIPL